VRLLPASAVLGGVDRDVCVLELVQHGLVVGGHALRHLHALLYLGEVEVLLVVMMVLNVLDKPRPKLVERRELPRLDGRGGGGEARQDGD
jgi:hypothetical protein